MASVFSCARGALCVAAQGMRVIDVGDVAIRDLLL